MFRKMNRKILYSLCAFFMMLFLMIAGGNKPGICIIVALASGSVGYFARDFLNKRRHKKLVQSMDMDMPDFLIDVAMLMESGMNIWDAVCRCVTNGDTNKPLYGALYKAIRSVDMGICSDYCIALEQMAEECRCSCVSNFVSLVVQNSRKGNSFIVQILVNSASFYRSERKNTATKLAGEATTLMLLPSAAVLIAMILLMAAPAIIQMIGGL